MKPVVKRALKIAALVLVPLFLVAFILWYPYEIPSLPQWKLQILDSNRKPMSGVQVNQEWIDPIEYGGLGATSGEERHTDASGVVVFPKRILHNRLAFGLAGRPSTRVIVCTQDEFGDVGWNGETPVPPATLVLKHGPCPYS